ncbi:MAG: SdrD B-like domain-containing protein [Chitinophagales bacterium]
MKKPLHSLNNYCWIALLMLFTSFSIQAQTDLSVTKTVTNSEPAIGDLITYTIIVENQSATEATGVVLTDNLPIGVDYQANSVTAGSFAHSSGTGTWTIGTVSASSSETLTVTVEVLSSGIHFNEVEVTASDQTDPDSTPNNGRNDEDDFADVCISVPEYLYGGSFTATVEAGLTDIQWYEGSTDPGDALIGENNTTLNITTIGNYYYTGKDANGCDISLCCPIIIESEPQKVAVGNFVFLDNDLNGTFNVGDAAIPGVTVQLFRADSSFLSTPLATAITDGNGYYYFDMLDPGEYKLFIPDNQFDVGQALVNTQSTIGTGDATTDDDDNGRYIGVTTGRGVGTIVIELLVGGEPTSETGQGANQYPGLLSDGSVNETIDFGFMESVAIGNLVYNDLNCNGIYDAGDTGIEGVEMRLYKEGAILPKPERLVVTAADGSYIFDDLAPGRYFVGILSSEFNVGEPLEGLISLEGGSDDETIDDNTDSNGRLNASFFNMITSGIIDVKPNVEPLNEQGFSFYAGTLPDDNVNLTIDFAFTGSNACSIDVALTGIDILCFGENTGSISTAVTGGVGGNTYIWSNGATTASINTISAGTYTVTVTDSNGTKATNEVTLSEPSDIVLTTSNSPVSINSGNDGTVGVSATGGNYTYEWSNAGKCHYNRLNRRHLHRHRDRCPQLHRHGRSHGKRTRPIDHQFSRSRHLVFR